MKRFLASVFLLALVAAAWGHSVDAPLINPTFRSLNIDSVGSGRVTIRAKAVISGDTLEFFLLPIDSCMAIFPGGRGSTNPNFLYYTPCNSNDTIPWLNATAFGDDSVKWLIDADTTRSIHLTGDSVIVETSSGSHIVFKSPDILTIQADTVGKTNILGFVTVVGSLRLMLDTATAGDVRMFLPFDTNLVGGPGHLWLPFWDANDGLMKLYPQDSVSGTGAAAQRLFADTGDISQVPVPLSDSSVLQGDSTVELRHEDQPQDTVTFTVEKIPDGAVSGTAKIAANAVEQADLADNAVGNAEMADNAVNTTEIVDGGVATGDIAQHAVDTSKLNVTNVGTLGQVLTNGGSGAMTWADDQTGGGGATRIFVDTGDNAQVPVPTSDSGVVQGDSTIQWRFEDQDRDTLNPTVVKIPDNAVTGSGKITDGAVLSPDIGSMPSDSLARILSDESGTGVFVRSIDPDFGAVLDIDSVGIDTLIVNTRLRLPTADNPDMVVEGQIAYDANNDMLVFTNGSADFAYFGRLAYCSRTISDPDQVVDDTIQLMGVEAAWAPFGITIVDCGIKTRTSTSYTVVFSEHTEPSNAGTETTIESVSTSASFEAEDDGTLSDNSIAAGSIVCAYVTDADDITQVMVWFTYYVNVGN